MRELSQVDIAPTIARVLGITLSEVDGCPIEEAASWNCRNAVLIIVDSLGWDLYQTLSGYLREMGAIASSGLVFPIRSVSNHTSPAIASILSGLYPEHHNIWNTEDAKASGLLSLPEIASAAGLRAGVVMERGGAEVYDGIIDVWRGVPANIDFREFDREICRLTLEVLASDPRLLVTYFIGIDKAAHLELGGERIREAAFAIDGYVGGLARAAAPGTMIAICADHPVHAGMLRRREPPCDVPLILGQTRVLS